MLCAQISNNIHQYPLPMPVIPTFDQSYKDYNVRKFNLRIIMHMSKKMLLLKDDEFLKVIGSTENVPNRKEFVREIAQGIYKSLGIAKKMKIKQQAINDVKSELDTII